MTNEELKQRLIELVKASLFRHIDKSCLLTENIVNDLIANGVTIREYGEWTGMDGDTCSKCGHNLSEIMDADSYYAVGFDIREIVACPFCGADMKGDDGKWNTN